MAEFRPLDRPVDPHAGATYGGRGCFVHALTVVSEQADPRHIGGDLGLGLSVTYDEGTPPAETAHEEAALEKHVVAGCDTCRSTGFDLVVRTEHENSEVVFLQFAHELFEVSAPELEHVLIPDSRLGTALQCIPDRLCNI